MNKLMIFTLAIAGIMTFGSCSSDDPDVNVNSKNEQVVTDEPSPLYQIPISDVQREQVNMMNELAFKVWCQMEESRSSESNMAFSPMSMYQLLSMCANGAESRTLEQFLDLLGDGRWSLDEINAINNYLRQELPKVDTSVRCTIYNACWMLSPLRPTTEFKDMLANNYNAGIFNFASFEEGKKEINAWCAEKSNGLINPYFGEDDEILPVELFNATYFEGKWSSKPKESTNKGLKFHNASGKISTPEFLPFVSGVIETEKYYEVNLSYGNKGYKMCIILPKDDNSLVDCMLAQHKSVTQGEESSGVLIYVPKFTLMEGQKDLLDVIRKLGVTDLTSFGKIYPETTLDRVTQKTVVTVDEKGTTAAGIFEGGMDCTFSGGGAQVLKIDRPFGFFIREMSSEVILFMGMVNEL